MIYRANVAIYGTRFTTRVFMPAGHKRDGGGGGRGGDGATYERRVLNTYNFEHANRI